MKDYFTAPPVRCEQKEIIGTEQQSQVKSALKKAAQAIKDIKNISHGMRPSMLDSLGLIPSLRELFREIESYTDIDIHFFHRSVPKHFDKEKELAIYRITQESLTNVMKYAKAKNVFVNLVKKDQVLSLSIEDDGAGFDKDKAMKVSGKRGSVGILIMQERAAQFDGEFIIESQIGKGTHILVEIPL